MEHIHSYNPGAHTGNGEEGKSRWQPPNSGSSVKMDITRMAFSREPRPKSPLIELTLYPQSNS